MKRKILGKWKGGRVFRDRHGQERWTIERMVNGARYTFTLPCRSEPEAEAELALFERDPPAYRTPTQAKQEQEQAREEQAASAIVVNVASVDEVVSDLQRKGRVPDYVDSTISYLRQWTTDLGVGRSAQGPAGSPGMIRSRAMLPPELHCGFPDCDRPAVGTLCQGHAQQKSRGLSPPVFLRSNSTGITEIQVIHGEVSPPERAKLAEAAEAALKRVKAKK